MPNTTISLEDAARVVLDTELGEMACTGSHAPAENALGLLRDALAATAPNAETVRRTHHRSGAPLPTTQPGKVAGLGDEIPCDKCGSALDTGLECTECGYDMASAVYTPAAPNAGAPTALQAAMAMLWNDQAPEEKDHYLKVAERSHAAAPAQQAGAPLPLAPSDWWRKRADEIEAWTARTGSTDAMRCFTDMRTLLQSATAATPQQATLPASEADEAREELDAVIACLGDDAAGLREDNPEDERAANMDRAAELLGQLATRTQPQAEPVGYINPSAHEGGRNWMSKTPTRFYRVPVYTRAQPQADAAEPVPNTFKQAGETEEAWIDRITGAATQAPSAAKKEGQP